MLPFNNKSLRELQSNFGSLLHSFYSVEFVFELKLLVSGLSVLLPYQNFKLCVPEKKCEVLRGHDGPRLMSSGVEISH